MSDEQRMPSEDAELPADEPSVDPPGRDDWTDDDWLNWNSGLWHVRQQMKTAAERKRAAADESPQREA